MKRWYTAAVFVLLVVGSLAWAAPQASGDGFGSDYPYPGSGAWNITGYTYVGNETIVMNGNLSINATGHLYLNNATILFNNTFNGEYGVSVGAGGRLTMVNSTISVNSILPSPGNTTFFADGGSQVVISGSTFDHVGFDSPNYTEQGVVIGDVDPSVTASTFRQSFGGLLLMGASGVTVSGLTLENITTYGVNVVGGDNVTIESSVAVGNGVAYAAYMSSAVSIRDSTASNSTVGIAVIGSSGCWAYRLNISSSYLGVAAEISDNSTFGPFINVSRSIIAINLNASRDNTIAWNFLDQNSAAIFLNNSDSNKVLSNIVTNGTDRGIFLSRSSGNEVGRNYVVSTLSASESAGIRVEDGSANLIHNNTVLDTRASGDSSWGIALLRSDGNTLIQNRVDGTSASRYAVGIYLTESPDNTLARNRVFNTSAVSNTGSIIVWWYAMGIFVSEDSRRNTIRENTIISVTTSAPNSGSLGIMVGGLFKSVDNNTIIKNDVGDIRSTQAGTLAIGIGIFLRTDYAALRDNRVVGVNAGAGEARGIHIEGTSHIILSRNVVESVTSGVTKDAYGVYFKNAGSVTMYRDAVRNTTILSAKTAYAVLFERTKGASLEGVQVLGGSVGLAAHSGSDRITSTNMSIKAVIGEDIHATGNSNVTLVNVSFGKFFITPGSRIRVQNFLHVKVLDLQGKPLPGVDVIVTDNGKEMLNRTTDLQGYVRWVITTSRIYFGDTNPRYNNTTVHLGNVKNVYDDHPRSVDMNTSHEEVFRAVATQLAIGSPKYRSNSSDTWNVSERTDITLSINYTGTSAVVPYYAVDGGAWSKYTGPFNLSGYSGQVNLQYRSSDGKWNVESPLSITLSVDGSAPTTTYSIRGPTYGTDPVYVRSSSLIELASSDSGGSGTSRTFYAFDGAGWSEYTGAIPLTRMSEGNHTFRFYAVDNVDNEEAVQTLDIVIDDTPPTTSLTPGDPKYGTDPMYISEVTEISLNASDSGAGLSAIHYTVDSGPLTAYTGPFMITAGGAHTITFNGTDNLGNEETPGTFQVTVDAEPPKANAGTDTEVEVGTNVTLSGKGSSDDVTILNWTWEITDPTSGRTTLYGPEVVYEVTEEGEYSVTLRVSDEVDHTSTDMITITVVGKPTPSGPALWGGSWLLLALVVAVVLGIIVWYSVLRRRKKGPAPGEEEAPEEGGERKDEGEAPSEDKGAEAPGAGTVLVTDRKGDIDIGMNYLVLTSDSRWCYEKFKSMVTEGAKGLCISTTQPAKLRIRYKLKEPKIYWLSDAASTREGLNPRRLEFEITKVLTDFMKAHEKGIIFIDGLEYLILENGFERVTKFLKKIGDIASKEGHTLLIILNPSALAPDPLTILKKNFDEVIER